MLNIEQSFQILDTIQNIFIKIEKNGGINWPALNSILNCLSLSETSG